MNQFVNEYQYTTDISTEAVLAWRHRKFMSGYISIPLLIILILVLSVGLGRFRPAVLALELLPLMLVFLFVRADKIAVKSERERVEVLFRDTAPVYRVEIGEDIRMTGPKSDSRVSFSDVEDMVETKNLLVLMIKGSMTIALSKNGFVQGDAEACKAYLKERISRYGK